MLPINYNMYPFALVQDLGDFFKTNLPEMTKVKGILEACKLMLNLPPKKISLEVAEGQRFYKYTFFSPGIHDIPLGWIVYVPQNRQLDVWLPDMPAPLAQWKGKKIEFKNYPILYDRLGFDSLFDRVINLI